MASDAILTARDVRKSFATAEGDLPVLNGVSLDLHAGESIALTGESGSGKSTLLHCIGCLETVDAGAISVDGQEITQLDENARAALRREKVAIVFQQLNLIPSLTVQQNLDFQARLTGRLDQAWSDTVIDRLGIGRLLTRYPEELSGGQQQRVAIGRAVAHRPPLVLADEPTGNLDESTAQDVLDLMLALVAETGAGLLLVTHSETVAARLSRRVHLRQGALS